MPRRAQPPSSSSSAASPTSTGRGSRAATTSAPTTNGRSTTSPATRRASTGRSSSANGVGAQPNLIVSQPSAFTGTARLIGRTPLAAWSTTILLVQLLDDAALSADAFVDEHFAFHGTVLNGTPQNEERWKRGVTCVTEMIGGRHQPIYVERHFPPEAKAEADALVRNVIAAMDRRLARLTWMAPETQARARAKLAAFTPKIGYPDRGAIIRAPHQPRRPDRQRRARPRSNISATSASWAGRWTAASGS